MKNNVQRLGQQGMASIVITSVFVSVIGLIVIGFSAMVRKNQRETLDRQLSTQAYYVAESGIEYARAVVRAKVANNLPIPEQPTCDGSSYTLGSFNAGVAEVSCLIVTNKVSSLYYDSVTASSNTVVPLVPIGGGSTIAKVRFDWKATEATSATPAQYCITDRSMPEIIRGRYYRTPCEFGTLVAVFARGSNLGSLSNPVVYMKPNSIRLLDNPPESVNFLTPKKIISAYSAATNDGVSATVTIAGMNAGEPLYLKLNSVYRDSSVTVTALDASNNAIQTTGQVVIDSTAKAQGVLKRIQARVPVSYSSAATPVAGIESSGAVCKRFRAAQGYLSRADLCEP